MAYVNVNGRGNVMWMG